MEKMNAAVVTSFDEPPQYMNFQVPQPKVDGEIVVEVLAVGLHPRTRSLPSARLPTPSMPGIMGRVPPLV